MTLYEELGVGPDASPEDIRHAYRNLARLLHPDQQSDETLRRLAEGQMKRLNAVCATLTDPVRRREHDAATAALVPVPRLRTRRLAVREAAAWFLAGLAVATLWWRLSPSRPPPSEDTRVSATPIQSQPAAGRRARTAAVPPQVTRQPARARMESGPQPELPLPSEPAAFEPPVLKTTVAPPRLLEPALAELPPAPVATEAPRFGGTWIYVPPRRPASGNELYPAEYIEAAVLEESGEVRGRYRARYRVPDRPISREVAFRFTGKTTGDHAAIAWSGAGGSEGEGELVLLSPNTVRVDWVATSMGSQLGLASGTAVLTRRREP